MLDIRRLVWDTPKELKFRGVNILSIDGDGIRAVFSLQMIKYICESLYGTSDTYAVQKFVSNFDMIVGSSFGGIIAVGLAHGKSIDDIMKIYTEIVIKVFSGNMYVDVLRHVRRSLFGNFYNIVELKDVISSEYGDSYMYSGIRPKVCVPLLKSSSVNNDVYLSRSYTNIRNSIEGTSSMSISDTLLSTCSSLDYFTPDTFLRGETLSDIVKLYPNPVELGIIESYDMFQNRCLGMILSIGTGMPNFDDVGTAGTVGTEPSVDKLIPEVINQRVARWCSARGAELVRFNPPKIASISYDESKECILENGKIITETYIKGRRDRIMGLSTYFDT